MPTCQNHYAFSVRFGTDRCEAQVDGDLVRDGVCGVLIAEKLAVTQPTVSEHLKILSQAGFLRSKQIKQWTFYKRDEVRIREVKQAILRNI